MRVVTLFTHSGHLMASVYTCIIDIYVEILTATVSRMRVVTLVDKNPIEDPKINVARREP